LKSANNGGTTTNYTYDGDGLRVAKLGSKLYWYGPGGETLAETDTSGNTTAEYIFFGGKRVAMLPGGGTPIYYVEDLLGTSRVTTTNAGVVCYDPDFYPFGGERPPYTNTCAQNNYKFEGKERDIETGNDDFGARYYSNRFGRWLSVDWSSTPVPVPYANLTNPQTLNLYAMVADDPESFADLDGHFLSSSMIPASEDNSGSNCGADGTCVYNQQVAARIAQAAAQQQPQSQNPTFTNLDKAAAASARADQKLQKENGGEYGSLVYSADGKTCTYTAPVTQGQRTTVDPFNTTGVPQDKPVAFSAGTTPKRYVFRALSSGLNTLTSMERKTSSASACFMFLIERRF